MASLFFTPFFSIGTIQVGRFQNIMFLQGMIWIIFDIAYIIGWMQRKYKIQEINKLKSIEVKYLKWLTAACLMIMVVAMKGEPQKFTSVYALDSFLNDNYKVYGEEYWKMVEQLNQKGDIVTIKDFSYVPEFLYIEESEEWSSGLRLFYDKKQVIVEKE